MFSVIQLPGSNRRSRPALRAEVGARRGGAPGLAQGARAAGRHGRGAGARRLLLRRLPALRRDGALLADHGRVQALRRRGRPGARRSATASRSCARRGSCPARSCATTTCTSCASSCTCASSTRARRSPRAPRPAACCGCRSSTGRAPTTRRRSCWPSSSATGQVVLRYVRRAGERDRGRAIPNGSLANIAGVANARGNVMGLMPHPEHAVEPGVGGEDGRVLLGSLLDCCAGARGERSAREPRVDLALAREHGLTDAEYAQIEQILGRTPSYSELGIFSVMWSEHCSYKSSKKLPAAAAHDGAAGAPGPGRERGRGRDRRRARRGVQDREPQPPVVHRAARRARPPASAGSCATSSRWARARSPRSTRCASARSTIRSTSYLLRGVVDGIGGYGNSVGVATVGGETTLPRVLPRQHPRQRVQPRRRRGRPRLPRQGRRASATR